MTTLTVGAGQTLTTCQTLGTANMTYILLNNVSAPGTCFVITKDNVTLNLNGHNITYATSPQTKPAFGIAALTCTEADATAGFCGGTFNNPTIFGPPATPGSDPPSMIKQGAGAFGSSDASPAQPGLFNEPWGVAVGPDGSVYVADTWNHRIQKFDARGTYITAWGQFIDVGGQSAPDKPFAFYGPRALAVDTEGNVWVVDTGNKRVREVFAVPGAGIATTSAQMAT